MIEESGEPSPRELGAYLSGEASASESAEVVRWAQSSPVAAARLDALRAAWDEATRPTVGGIGSWNADEMWSAIAPHLDGNDRGHRLHLVRTPRRRASSGRNLAPWATAAACAALVIGIWTDHRAEQRREASRPPKQELAREYRTDRGQRASVTLPDGSAFQLGPISVLRVPSGYGAPARVVELEGDGYFNVTHDAKHPFSVRTARSTIRDIGTRFVVRARAAEPRVEVAVADGKVAIDPIVSAAAMRRVARNRGSLLVGAGQAAMIDEQGLARLLPRSAVAAQFAWTRGEFVFDHVPVPRVLAELSRWYGSTFVLADQSLDTVRLTTVLKGETMLEALVVLETSLDVDARVDADRVTLTPHSKSERPNP
jgi:transmembrane sensor